MRTGLAVVTAAVLWIGPALAQEAPAPVDPSKLTDDPLGQAAVRFFDQAFNERQVQEAFDAYVGDDYTQHNPQAPTGREASIAFLSGMIQQVPDLRFDFKRVLVDGDMVMIHSHVTAGPDDRGSAVVDILRAEDDRFVEHWDVIQAVPEQAANDNTMF